MDAADRGRTGDDATPARHAAHSSRAAPAGAARSPGQHAGCDQRWPGDLRCGTRRADRGRVRELWRDDRSRRTRGAARRGPRAAAAVLDRRSRRPRRAALPGSRRHAAPGHGATPSAAGLDRRLLAASAADAPGGALGRCGAVVRRRPARRDPTGRPGTRSGRLHRPTPGGRDGSGGWPVRLRDRARWRDPRRPGPGARPDRAARRRRCDLVGRAADPRQRRPLPTRPGPPPHRGRAAGAVAANSRRTRDDVAGDAVRSVHRALGAAMSTLSALTSALSTGSVEVIDLTAPLAADTPKIQLPPEFGQTAGFELEEISRYDDRGPAWYWNNFRSGEHTGTHFDAPNHWVSGKDGDDVASVPAANLIAPAAVIDFSHVVAGEPDFLLEVDHITAWEREHEPLTERGRI